MPTYTKQTIIDQVTVATSEIFGHIEDGIVANADAINELSEEIVDLKDNRLTSADKQEIADMVAETQVVTNLENAIVELGGNVTPTYIDDEVEVIAEKILDSRNAYSFVMAMASDLHTTGSDTSAIGVKHMGMAMDKINAITQLDLVAILGDVMVGYFDESYEEGFKHVKKCFHEISKSVPFIQLQGNHDQLKTDTTTEAQQKYFSRIGANNVGTVTDFNNRFRNYGYRDFDDQRLRVIYLNSADVSELEITDDCYISKEQFSWLVNTALDFSSKSNKETWHFMVLSHHPLNWLGTSMPNLLDILDAYKGGTSGSITVDGTSIAYNFTSNTRPKFVAHFHGHIHNFRTEKLGTNGVLSITIPNACFDRNNEYGTYSGYTDEIHTKYGDVDVDGNQRQYNKTSNTVNDTSFNIVVVDMENEEIHAYCYGAGIHRTVTFDGVLTEVEKDEVDEPTTPIPSYTNLVPSAIAYNDQYTNGYHAGYRGNSSGTETVYDGAIVSGYIAYNNEVIRVHGTNATNLGTTGFYVMLYDADKKFIQTFAGSTSGFYLEQGLNGLYQVRIVPTETIGTDKFESAKYIRCSLPPTVDPTNFIVTLNEEIS